MEYPVGTRVHIEPQSVVSAPFTGARGSNPRSRGSARVPSLITLAHTHVHNHTSAHAHMRAHTHAHPHTRACDACVSVHSAAADVCVVSCLFVCRSCCSACATFEDVTSVAEALARFMAAFYAPSDPCAQPTSSAPHPRWGTRVCYCLGMQPR